MRYRRYSKKLESDFHLQLWLGTVLSVPQSEGRYGSKAEHADRGLNEMKRDDELSIVVMSTCPLTLQASANLALSLS